MSASKLNHKSLRAYLIKDIQIKVPGTNLVVTVEEDTYIKVDPVTRIAWIKAYQVELTRQQYSIVC